MVSAIRRTAVILTIEQASELADVLRAAVGIH
jgi:hypothetical protein